MLYWISDIISSQKLKPPKTSTGFLFPLYDTNPRKKMHYLKYESKYHLDIANADIEKAIDYCKKSINKNPSKQIKGFKKNYKDLQNIIKNHGKYKRKNMPRVNWRVVKEFQQHIVNGYLDIKAPFGTKIAQEQGITPQLTSVEGWLKSGLLDKELEDDKVKAEKGKLRAKDLIPLQDEIFLSKVVKNWGKYGFNVKKEMGHKRIIVGKNNEIIDGHHRWATFFLINPRQKVKVLKVHLNTPMLLKTSNLFGKAIAKENDT